ncbi:MAG: hypothetical protein LAT57_03230 [Balneolales bacterium]|nr:hypothetical protein [Balneolales bacterium]
MSYALRNTLILLATLLIMIGGSWLFLNYKFVSELEAQGVQVERKEAELQRLSASADNFLLVQERHARIKYEFENHSKELLEDNSLATVFDFLRSINRGLSYTTMNFALRDSVRNNDHGIIRVRIDGEATYRGLFNFLTIMEQSSPIVRVTDLRLAPMGREADVLSRVRYELNADFYYARGTTTTDSEIVISDNISTYMHNPFYALIHQIPDNLQELPDVDASRLVGLVRNGAYILNQRNQMEFLQIGDPVYLGTLQSVNMNERTAAFRLDRGGIRDVVVLRINETE